MKKKTRKFEVASNTYDVMVQIKKDYGLQNGDEVIWWLIREVGKGQEASAKSEAIPPPVQQLQPVPVQQTSQPTPIQPVEQPIQQPVNQGITPPPHYEQKPSEEIPYIPPEPEPPTRKNIHEIHNEVDNL